MKIGYARVSTEDQNLDLQIHALQMEGCKVIYKEKMTGTLSSRPVLRALFQKLNPGDTLVVWKLDRLGRSIQHLIEIMNELHERKISFQSISPNIDTSSPTGKFYFHILAALAEFEAALISERTKAGLQAARRNGKILGRPPCLSRKQIVRVRFLMRQRNSSIDDVARKYGVGKSTIRRALSKNSDL